jgi:hypothetical protein
MLLMPILFIISTLILKIFVHSIGWVDSLQRTGEIIVAVAVAIAIMSIFIVWIRISFFPFFIIDKNAQSFDSIKLSLATTKRKLYQDLIVIIGIGRSLFFDTCFLVICSGQ